MGFGAGMDLGRARQFSCLLFSPSLFLLQGCRLAWCRQGKVQPVPCSCLLLTHERALPLTADRKGAVSQVVSVSPTLPLSSGFCRENGY